MKVLDAGSMRNRTAGEPETVVCDRASTATSPRMIAAAIIKRARARRDRFCMVLLQFCLTERLHRGSVDRYSVYRKARAMARTVPGLFERIKSYDAAFVRADGGT